MPKVRRAKLPPALLAHLLMRMRQRQISHDQLISLALWLDTEPDVPEGKWFKRFSGSSGRAAAYPSSQKTHRQVRNDSSSRHIQSRHRSLAEVRPVFLECVRRLKAGMDVKPVTQLERLVRFYCDWSVKS
jgi:hypothetical protein